MQNLFHVFWDWGLWSEKAFTVFQQLNFNSYGEDPQMSRQALILPGFSDQKRQPVNSWPKELAGRSSEEQGSNSFKGVKKLSVQFNRLVGIGHLRIAEKSRSRRV